MIKKFAILAVVTLIFGVFFCQKSPDRIQGVQPTVESEKLQKTVGYSDFSAIFSGGGNKQLYELTQSLALKMNDADFFESIVKVFDGYPVYSFHLKQFLTNTVWEANFAAKLAAVESEFRKEIPDSFFTKNPDFSIKVEVFLHPKYRDKNLDRNVLIAFAPVYNDSLLTVIPAFDFSGKETQVDAWTLPAEKSVLVVRIDETPTESKEFGKTAQPSTDNKKELEALAKTTTGGWLTICWSGAHWKTENKGEPDACWPPEYFTKTWWCNNPSCTSFSGKQEKHERYWRCTNWIPPMLSCGDTQLHWVGICQTSHYDD